MANVTATTNFVARKMLEFFQNGHPLLATSNRDYLEQFQSKGYATGGAIRIKLPINPPSQRGLSVTPSGIDDLVLDYTITDNDIYNVVFSGNLYEELFDFVDMRKALTVPEQQSLVDNYAYPAYQRIMVDQEAEAAYRLKVNSMFTPIDEVSKLSAINNFSQVSAVTVFMDSIQLAPEKRTFMMNLRDANNFSNSLQNMFNPSINSQITRHAWVGGSQEKGEYAGMDCMKSNQLLKHVSGGLSATTGITVTDIDDSGTVITFAGVPATTSQLVNAGDLFSIPSVNLLQRIGAGVIPEKLVVVAMEDANGDGAGNVTITLPFPLLISGMHANVSALPAPGAEVIAYPDYNQNYAYTRAGLSAVPLTLGNIHGAINSDNKGMNDCPVKAYAQGSVESGVNIFRIAQILGLRAFTPYVVPVPSAAP
jgi:hypothetical protein